MVGLKATGMAEPGKRAGAEQREREIEVEGEGRDFERVVIIFAVTRLQLALADHNIPRL